MVAIPSPIRDFLGYGNLRGKVWFIGLEEGFQSPYTKPKHSDFEEYLQKQHQNRMNFEETMDLDKAMVQMEGWQNFEEKIKHTKTHTWLFMSKLLEGLEVDYESYLHTTLGHKSSNHLITEILPLPTPSNNDKDWPTLYHKYYATKKEYKRVELPYRIKLLRDKILQYQPSVIMCYGISKWASFEKVFDVDFKEIRIDGKRVRQAKDLGAHVYLTPFFGNGQFSDNLAEMFHYKIIK